MNLLQMNEKCINVGNDFKAPTLGPQIDIFQHKAYAREENNKFRCILR